MAVGLEMFRVDKRIHNEPKIWTVDEFDTVGEAIYFCQYHIANQRAAGDTYSLFVIDEDNKDWSVVVNYMWNSVNNQISVVDYREGRLRAGGN
jgi:hypothetical protein